MNQHASPKGYAFNPKNKVNPYQVYLSVGGKPKYIGAFPTKELAHAEYLKARADYPMAMHDPLRPYQPHPKERCKVCGDFIAQRKLQMHKESCARVEARRYEPLDAKNRLYTIGEETKTISEWIKLTGINYYTVVNRWKRASCDDNLFKPVEENRFKKG